MLKASSGSSRSTALTGPTYGDVEAVGGFGTTYLMTRALARTQNLSPYLTAGCDGANTIIVHSAAPPAQEVRQSSKTDGKTRLGGGFQVIHERRYLGRWNAMVMSTSRSVAWPSSREGS